MRALTKRRKGDGTTGEGTAGQGAAPAAAPPEQKKAARAPRASERLRSVVRETTFGAGVEMLEGNARFKLAPDQDGSSRWLALALPVERIGGLSEKSKRDEAKGSFVQQISANHIEVVATAELLDAECVAIVPSQGTLATMSEYTLLTGAVYDWIVVTSREGRLQVAGDIGTATYEDAVAVQNGAPLPVAVSVQDAHAAAEAVAEPVAEPVPEPVAEAAPPIAQADVPDPDDPLADEGFYESLSETEDYDGQDDEMADLFDEDAEDAEDAVEDPALQEQPADPGQDESEAPQAPHEQYIDAQASREITEAEVRDSIARRFLSEGLELVVDLDEFARAFPESGAPHVSASVEHPADGTDWLAEQVAQLALAANSELEALHARHYDELRQQFVDFTGLHIQEVVKDVSTSDADGKFGKLMAAVQRDLDAARAGSHDEAMRRRRAIEAHFADEAEEAAQVAASHARLLHAQTNSGRRQAELDRVEREITQDADAAFESERQRVLEIRRVDAEIGMQRGKTLILQELAKTRSEQLDAEATLLEGWNTRMLTVVDENRKADVARAEALAEQLARSNAVEDEKRASAERIEQIRADHADRIRELEARAEQVRADAIADLSRRDDDWSRRLEKSEGETQAAGELIAALQSQMKDLSASVNAQYADRIASLEAEKKSYADEVERASRAASRSYRVLALLLSVAAAAALLVGLVGGWAFGHGLG